MPPALASSTEIADAARLARERGRLGIDTEFMSEGRYRALLCLVQIAVDDPQAGDAARVLLIDALDHADASPVAELMSDPAVEVILHAGRQDVAILRRMWHTSSPTCSTPRSPPALPEGAPRPVTGTCSGPCSADGSARQPATPAGTPGR